MENYRKFSNTKAITEIEGKGMTIKEVSVCVKTTRDVAYAYKTVWTDSVNRKLVAYLECDTVSERRKYWQGI